MPASSSSSRVSDAAVPPERAALEAGGRYAGLLAFRGDVRVDGEMEGRVVANGTLWVGETGLVRADIQAERLVVAGTVIGEVVARERIELLATANVEGDLHAPRIALEEGSFLRGRCQTGRTAEDPDKGRESSPSSP